MKKSKNSNLPTNKRSTGISSLEKKREQKVPAEAAYFFRNEGKQPAETTHEEGERTSIIKE